MRGTRARQAAVARERGIIPAYAGNTMRSRTAWPTIRDHPRVCGEHIMLRLTWIVLWGSSPRMRGTPRLYPSLISIAGIIPAYAGNTLDSATWWIKCRDHPRVCGEHRSRRTGPSTCSGSSPRMRGTLEVRVANTYKQGIIPAYAGNTYHGR